MRNAGCEKFDEAAMSLPEELRAAALFLPERDKERAEELRLRCGRPTTAVLPEGEHELGRIVTQRHLEDVLVIASSASRHSVAECIKNGYVTAPGGHRIGLCGTAVISGGEVSSIRGISSVCIRIARQLPGIASGLADSLRDEQGMPRSTLILSPPGSGKTTLLRDLIRIFSNDGIRTSVIDERGEICAMRHGCPQFDVGHCTDVMELAPRADAVRFMLRSMSPMLIAVDELCTPEDVGAVLEAIGSGASVLATAHGASTRELSKRPVMRALLESGVFSRFVKITNNAGQRTYETGEF